MVARLIAALMGLLWLSQAHADEHVTLDCVTTYVVPPDGVVRKDTHQFSVEVRMDADSVIVIIPYQDACDEMHGTASDKEIDAACKGNSRTGISQTRKVNINRITGVFQAGGEWEGPGGKKIETKTVAKCAVQKKLF